MFGRLTVHEDDLDEPERNGATTVEDVEAYLRSRHSRCSAGDESTVDPRSEGHGEVERHAAERRAPDATAFLAELSDSRVSKPYLDRLPDEYSAQRELFEWLDGLLSTAGREATVSALKYYESIGWLSERSREKLEEIAAGLAVPDATERSLDIEDHRESFLYVARLAHRSSG